MDMIYIFMGVVAFAFFVVYDINSIIMKNNLLSCCFFSGFCLLSAATAGIVIITWNIGVNDILRVGIFGIIAGIFLLLLLYSLFFALPFHKTYLETDKKAKVQKYGVYALCRHPGVLWFIAFYLFLGLALMSALLLMATAVYGFLNILYVLFQDRWTFPRSFQDYEQYKKETPFLVPNQNSLKSCLATIIWKEGTVNEL
jgi:protein-S-isoprenylcysteine O-methyltransferase Ste14